MNREATIADVKTTGKRAFDAFARRDVDEFMNVYSKDLRYTQANGVTIGWDKLAKDVRRQLNEISDFKSSQATEFLEITDAEAVTIGVQEAVIWVRIFLVFKKRWNLYRRSKQWWKRTDEGWKVTKAVVMEETVV